MINFYHGCMSLSIQEQKAPASHQGPGKSGSAVRRLTDAESL